MRYALIKSKSGGFKFLIPADSCEFVTPEYIARHAADLSLYTELSLSFLAAISKDPLCKSDRTLQIMNLAEPLKLKLAEFAAYAKPIGIPFDLRDVDAFIASTATQNSFDIIIEV